MHQKADFSLLRIGIPNFAGQKCLRVNMNLTKIRIKKAGEVSWYDNFGHTEKERFEVGSELEVHIGPARSGNPDEFELNDKDSRSIVLDKTAFVILRELTVTFTASFDAKVMVEADPTTPLDEQLTQDNVMEAADNIDIPESEICSYNSGTFEVNRVEDEDGNSLDLDLD